MEKIVFDSGIQELPLGEGVLRFNPTDPNLYARFFQAAEAFKTPEIATDADPVAALTQLDSHIKKQLNAIFGMGNDFDEILGGVSLLAVAGNGSTVLDNLLAALTPVLAEGAKKCADALSASAVAEAQKRRDALA